VLCAGRWQHNGQRRKCARLGVGVREICRDSACEPTHSTEANARRPPDWHSFTGHML